MDDLRRQMVENDGAYQGVISFDVKVTNTGSTVRQGGGGGLLRAPLQQQAALRKASVNLVQFGKTGLLEPNASETVHFDI